MPILTFDEFVRFLNASRFPANQDEVPKLGANQILVDEGEQPYEFETDDLYYLYCLTRRSAAVSVLEFGSGWSTLAFAKAIDENRKSMANDYAVRHPNPFKILSVDASSHWMSVTLGRLSPELRDLVLPLVSTPKISELQASYVSLYEELPSFTPDIIYLDGPDPEQVSGSLDGFCFLELHGLPMSADILRMEPHLWPWTLIVTDGRTANARFLQSNLKRNWQFIHDPFGDRTIFRLDETPFGQVTEEHINARLKFSRATLKKETPNVI